MSDTGFIISTAGPSGPRQVPDESSRQSDNDAENENVYMGLGLDGHDVVDLGLEGIGNGNGHASNGASEGRVDQVSRRLELGEIITC